jgi:hypothetical protein
MRASISSATCCGVARPPDFSLMNADATAAELPTSVAWSLRCQVAPRSARICVSTSNHSGSVSMSRPSMSNSTAAGNAPRDVERGDVSVVVTR